MAICQDCESLVDAKCDRCGQDIITKIGMPVGVEYPSAVVGFIWFVFGIGVGIMLAIAIW